MGGEGARFRILGGREGGQIPAGTRRHNDVDATHRRRHFDVCAH